MPVTDYINYILSECQPLDEIAIWCFARMYYIHIGIIMDDKEFPKPKPKPPRLSKPKSPKAKPVKFVMQSYGLRRPRPRVQNFNCIICQKKF